MACRTTPTLGSSVMPGFRRPATKVCQQWRSHQCGTIYLETHFIALRSENSAAGLAEPRLPVVGSDELAACGAVMHNASG